MRIYTNYSSSNQKYNYNMSKCNKPCFQANLLPKLEERLIREAKDAGLLDKLNRQFKNIKKWGSPKSFISTAYDLEKCTESLSLENYHLSSNYGGSLGVKAKDSLLKQFLSLKEKNILGAELNILKAVNQNKTEAILKIVQSPKYIKEITGEINPSDEKLAAAIENLSESELIDYRFGLKEHKFDDKFLDIIPGIVKVK